MSLSALPIGVWKLKGDGNLQSDPKRVQCKSKHHYPTQLDSKLGCVRDITGIITAAYTVL